MEEKKSFKLLITYILGIIIILGILCLFTFGCRSCKQNLVATDSITVDSVFQTQIKTETINNEIESYKDSFLFFKNLSIQRQKEIDSLIKIISRKDTIINGYSKLVEENKNLRNAINHQNLIIQKLKK